MDPIISQSEQQYQAPMQSAPKHFLNKKFIVTFVILALLGTGAYAGIWYWQRQQLAQEVVPTFTPRPSVTATADPVADWKTYTNTQYGFEFKYPNNYTVSTNQSTNVAPAVSSPYVDVEIRNYQIPSLIGGNSITIGEVIAIKYPIGGNRDGGIEYQIDIPSSNITIFFGGKNSSSLNYVSEYDQILSTFKFTPSTGSTSSPQADSVSGQFCGGIAGKLCPSGYSCKLDGNYPDAGGTCIKN